MKKYIILALTSLLALTSCESFLDRSPLSDLSPSSYFKDKAEMKNWNAGIYDAFQSALSKRQVLFGDVRSDNVTGTTYEDSKIYIDNDRGLNYYPDLYKVSPDLSEFKIN